MIRQPIIAIMGHVDHGKTLLLDTIRGTAVQAKEAGGITQAIGASIIPINTIKKICGDLLKALKQKITLPGLLFIDTPGHAAFTNLRKRGGNLADMAILVIDINEGVKPQTKESIEILKQYKTPFIIAANKVDLIEGWANKKEPIIKTITELSQETQRRLDLKIYDVVAQIYELGLQSDRFDRVEDFTKQIGIVPVSAKTGQGIPELLMIITGLAQKYLEQDLETNIQHAAKGTILEVKEQKGLGTVLDTIIYDGTLKTGATIIIGTLTEPITAKVKALLEPEPLAEMREKRSKFRPVTKATAATGVRIVAPGTEEAIAGMPLLEATENEEELKKQLKKEVEEVTATDPEGILVKADSLGSLEALITLLREHGVQIRKASIGPITKKDISDAETAKDPLQKAILGFNIPKPETTETKIITNDVIYRLIEEYDKWKETEQKKIELKHLKQLTKPCKIQLLKGYVFRQSNPAIAGVEVLAGTLKSNTPVMKQGKELTRIKGIQLEQENVEQAEKGKKVAACMPNIIIGRQVQEGDTLYSYLTEQEFRTYKEYRQHLTEEEKELLREIADMMRTDNPVWGI